jgi:glycosyltransferase involved in cell wall biosynthesis
MKSQHDVQGRLKQQLNERISEGQLAFGDECLKIDLHCHDHNSNVPDEALGRILGVPETWLPTSQLLTTLDKAGMTARTITNHNNARSCWELLEKGIDVLPGAEFSCHIPDLDVGVHVLTYGFSPEQEERLKILRRDIYSFLEYTAENDLPTALAHPLDFYAPHGLPELEKYEKVFLLFNNFEVLNGQRDTYSSLLTWEWLRSFDQEHLERLEKRFDFSAGTFCRDPWRKTGVGGSDDHFGVFAGRTGTLLSTSHLEPSLRGKMKSSELALSALRVGNVAPFGEWNDGRKLNLALLDYFAGLVLNLKDPGLGRILLHKGTPWQKMSALLISNAIHEVRRHRYTMRFLKTFHGAVRGQPPTVMTRFLLRRYQPELLKVIEKLVRASEEGIGHLETPIAEELFTHFAGKLSRRIEAKVSSLSQGGWREWSSLEGMIERLELPSVVRTLVQPSERSRARAGRKMSLPSMGEFFDGLSFPFLASGLVAGSMFATARVLHGKRAFSTQLAERFPELAVQKRVLWLTDTFADKNGVSSVLQLARDYSRQTNLPVDFLVCHDSLESEENLRVVRPLSSFTLSFYPQQPFRIPNLAEVQNIVEAGGYSTIVCSTEGPMAAVALYFKHALKLPVYFYVHTDWLAFAQQNETLREVNVDRVRRMMRALYSQFDGLFVLNSEQKNLFEGESFQLPCVFQTAHWASESFRRMPQLRRSSIAGLKKEDVVLLYAGRLSEEKGVFELPAVYAAARHANPRVRLVFAGTGPAESKLRELLPEAVFLGWQPQTSLCELYNRADLLLLPSTFDTFGCVVLEAMSCGLPVCAYAVKGPADIVDHGVSGFLARTPEDFVGAVALFAAEPEAYEPMRAQAFLRSTDYQPHKIMSAMLKDLGFSAGAEENRISESAGKTSGKEKSVESQAQFVLPPQPEVTYGTLWQPFESQRHS